MRESERPMTAEERERVAVERLLAASEEDPMKGACDTHTHIHTHMRHTHIHTRHAHEAHTHTHTHTCDEKLAWYPYMHVCHALGLNSSCWVSTMCVCVCVCV